MMSFCKSSNTMLKINVASRMHIRDLYDRKNDKRSVVEFMTC